MPALLNNALTAISEEDKAPVCDEAALTPASLVPALIAAILHPFLIN